MCRGSSVSVKETTEFLSFPSSRTCLRQKGRGQNVPLRSWRDNARQRTSLGTRCRSPHAEQAIVSGAGQEVEAVAVGGPRGGEAQGRHSGGVSCEPLQDRQQFFWVQCSHEREVQCVKIRRRGFKSQQWTHPVDLFGVQVPHLDHLTSGEQQLPIGTHTQAGHCRSVRLPLAASWKRPKYFMSSRNWTGFSLY